MGSREAEIQTIFDQREYDSIIKYSFSGAKYITQA